MAALFVGLSLANHGIVEKLASLSMRSRCEVYLATSTKKCINGLVVSPAAALLAQEVGEQFLEPLV